MQQPLFPQAEEYPPLLDEPHFVLDYHVRDRARARARAEEARRSIEEASGVHAGIEELVAKEATLRNAQAELLRQEEARRVLAREDDERLAADQQRHLMAAAATRLDRIDHACAASDAWLAQQQDVHNADVVRLSDELQQQRSRLAQESEELQLESALGNLEVEANRRLVDLRRRREVDTAARELRQGVRTELLGREHEDELTWRQQWTENERERLELHDGMSQKLQDVQVSMLDAQRHEVNDQLSITDRMREAQLSLVSQVRLARGSARRSQSEADSRSRACSHQLEMDTQQFSQECSEQMLQLRRQREQQVQEQHEALLQEQAHLQEAIDEQDRERHGSMLAEERAHFKERLSQLWLEDRAQVLREQDELRKEIARLQRVRLETEQDRACLQHRRKLAEQREVELGRELTYLSDEPLPKEERRHIRRKLTQHVPRPQTSSDSDNLRRRQRPVTPLTPFMASTLGSDSSSEALSPPGHLSSTPTVRSDSEDPLPPPTRLGRRGIAAGDTDDSDFSSRLAWGAAPSSNSLSAGAGSRRRRRHTSVP